METHFKTQRLTYSITLATSSALRSRQASVSLLSGLTRRPDQTNQTWMTLEQEEKKTNNKNWNKPREQNNICTNYLFDKQ